MFYERPIVEVSVTVDKDGNAIFKPFMEDTSRHFKKCLTGIIDHNHRIPRVEKLLFPG